MTVKLRWKILKNGDKSAYLDIYGEGERYYEFLKIYIRSKDDKEDKKERKLMAEAVRVEKELTLQANHHRYVPTSKKKVNFIKYFEAYLENYSKKDIRKVRYSLEKFKKYSNGRKITFQNMTVQYCEGFKNYLLSPDCGLSGETPYDYWKRFKGVFKEAVKDKIILSNPCDGIVFKGSQKQNNQLRKNVLTQQELQALAKTECGSIETKRAFLFACFTGLGIAEIRKLIWKRINNNKIKLFREKNGEQILIDLHPVAISLLGDRSNNEDLIFDLPSDVAIGKNLKRWMKRAGIEKSISFYCGRHTFATQLLLNGANLKTVADCMGHSSTKHTLKYLNYVDSLKTKAINSLPNLEL